MISVEQLDFGYNSKKGLFQKLNLTIEPNKIYGLLGRNGMGKSTLLKLMTGFLQPTNGTLQVNDWKPGQRKSEFMEQIFFLNEDFELPPLSISNYLKSYAAFYPKFDLNKFYTILEEFEVDKNSFIPSLSFGQKKKVFIAFGLATQAKYIFLDEPTNGLDIPSKSQFRKLMARHFSQDQSIIISTHQIRDLSNLLDAVIILEEGEILLSMDIAEIENKLLFSSSHRQDSSALYSEQVAGGTINVYPNPETLDSQIEIESFFNALVLKPNSLLQILNS